MKSSNFVRNLMYAFGAQAISLALSLLMALVVPKLLGIEDYSFWQLFIFYCGYSGILHFGLIDGVYLKYGGKKFTDLDFSLMGSQFFLFTGFQIIIALMIIITAKEYIFEVDRLYVVYGTLAYMIIYNASAFLGYIFQAVNETNKYSLSVMVDRIFFIIIVIVAMLNKNLDFEFFINFYILSKALALIYCLYVGKDILLARKRFNIAVLKEMLDNITIGSKLLIANIAGALILGVGRLVIDNVWGVTTFGRFSFALSLTNFFLLFISQVSMVLFPALRQIDKEQLKFLYIDMRRGLSIFLPVIFILYIPIKLVLEIWLPKYQDSLEYMALLLPLCIFDGKMQMLCNTYFKVLRKESLLLLINVITFVCSLLLCSFGAYVLHDIQSVIVFMVIAIALRSIFSEVYLANLMQLSIFKEVGLEIIIITIFILSALYLNDFYTLGIMFFSYLVYLLLNKAAVIEITSKVKKLLN
ncbi:oligosaccharide flippase family protein [Peribacillus sp. SCS-26]|uniref:oligosaccharide flippase family protein n=1 Tax=Paraperibacillus marinus TaxID=3115295 RepID=UPI003905C0A2